MGASKIKTLIDCFPLCHSAPRELSWLLRASQNVQHKMATGTISSDVKFIRAGHVNSKNIVLSRTASTSVLSPKNIFLPTLIWFYCPRGTPVYKDNCSTVRLLRNENHREFRHTHLFDSSWPSWFRSSCGCLRFTGLNHQPTSLKFLPSSDGFGVNCVHYAFSSKVDAGGRSLSFLSPLLCSRDWISWARQRWDQVHFC